MSYVDPPFRRASVPNWSVAFVGAILFFAAVWHYHLDTGSRFATTMESATLAGLALSIVAIGVSLAKNAASTSRVETTLRFALLGSMGALLLTGWLLLVLRLQAVPLRDVSFVAMTMIGVGASAGTFYGVNYDRLDRRTDALLERTNRLDAFVGIVGHDLRNPLNKAQGHLQQARETGKPRHFEAVERAHEQMERLVREIGCLAEPADDGLDGDDLDDVGPIDVAVLAEGVWEPLDADPDRLHVAVDDRIVGERRRLRVLFRNLFENAVEHGGPTVNVRIGELETGFFVEDDGKGIPVELRELVWQGGFTASGDGAGFGLAIVRRIAEAHGWRVMIVEGSDGGARVEFTDVDWADRRPAGTAPATLLS